ncbi:MAG TPA: hypothetical protein DCL77_19115 [Prolixibacteraceae bacterium]|jgi:hypothetical protein|nr:hypothetical protein [Prolixibacteraceae bacterium]
MKPKKLLLILGIILFISGCSDFIMICSLNPFYLEKNIVLSPEMEGYWSAQAIKSKSDSTSKSSSHWELADTTSTWHIKQFISEEKVKTKRGKDSTVFRPQNYYIVKLADKHPDSIQYQFQMVLFRVKDHLYADFRPYEILAIKNSRMAKENYFKVHTVARITIQNKQFNVSWLGADYMKEMIEKKRVRIKYNYVHDAGRLLLTASSEELTHMIERYGDETRFIDWQDQPAQLKLTHINQLP